MSGDDLKKLLTGAAPDAEALEALARGAEQDEKVRVELEGAAGTKEFASRWKAHAHGAPVPPNVAALVERIASHPPTRNEPAAAEPLTQLGQYTDLVPIGRGGMGTVYRAFDPRLRREVALKMLSADVGASAEARERFQREARAAAALDHPNILAIHAIETIDGRDVLVLPLNDGENLEAMIRRDGPVPVEELARIGAAVADGLAAAHAAGIVHRDIKPANILLSADRQEVRLADFGLARMAGDPALTQGGTMAGTPHFLSPEQTRGEAADARSDIFGLGATLDHAATGRLPFPGEDTPTVLNGVAHHRPPAAHPAPAWLRALLAAMLEKSPGRRPQSAAEIAAALRTCSTRWSRKRWQRLMLRAAAVLCLVAGAAFAVVKWRERQQAAVQQQRLTAAQEAATPFVVSGKKTARFASLNDALAALSDGDTLTLETGGLIPVRPHDLGKRSVVIRAAPRRGTVLTPAKRDDILLTTSAKLRLENLSILHSDGGADPTPLLVAEAGAEIMLDRCRVTAPAGRTRFTEVSQTTIPLIAARGANRVEFNRTIVTARRSSLVGFTGTSGEAGLKVTDCSLGINALMRTGKNAGVKIVLTLEHNTVSSAMLALLGGTASRIEASGSQCFFDLFSAPIRAPGLREGDVMQILSWRGERNAWQIPGALISFSNEPDPRLRPIAGSPALEQLRRLYPGSDVDSFETTETFRQQFGNRRVLPMAIPQPNLTLPESIAKRAPGIGVRGAAIGPE